MLQNFRPGIWSADSECYKTLGRVTGLQTETAKKNFRQGIWSAD